MITSSTLIIGLLSSLTVSAFMIFRVLLEIRTELRLMNWRERYRRTHSSETPPEQERESDRYQRMWAEQWSAIFPNLFEREKEK